MEKISGIRLNKFIAESGICSRREADKFIEKGVVVINGRRAVIGDVVKPKDKVTVNGHKLEPLAEENKLYIAFNKPVGVTCTTEDSTKGNIIDYVNHSTRIFNIGRLDKDSQGLILLTNDGDIVNKILRAENSHQKEYIGQSLNTNTYRSMTHITSLGFFCRIIIDIDDFIQILCDHFRNLV
jgi:23S rRNA pseudouridine2604 synthase